MLLKAAGSGLRGLAKAGGWLYKDMPKSEVAMRLAMDGVMLGTDYWAQKDLGLSPLEMTANLGTNFALSSIAGPAVSKLGGKTAVSPVLDMVTPMVAWGPVNNIKDDVVRSIQGELTYEKDARIREQMIKEKASQDTLSALGLIPQVAGYHV